MNIEDTQLVRGEVHLTVVRGDITESEYEQIIEGRPDPDLAQRIVKRERRRNLVTNTGRAGIATIMTSGSTRPTHIAVGNTAITPAATDTTLSGEIDRNALSTITTISTYFARYAATFTTTDFNDTVRGVALFTASASGDMWTIASANVLKDSSSTLIADWRIQVLT